VPDSIHPELFTPELPEISLLSPFKNTTHCDSTSWKAFAVTRNQACKDRWTSTPPQHAFSLFTLMKKYFIIKTKFGEKKIHLKERKNGKGFLPERKK
jgi:hypothetical protein